MNKGGIIKYIDLIKDLYVGTVTNIRICGGLTINFSITIGLHLEYASSPFVFVIVMDGLTRDI